VLQATLDCVTAVSCVDRRLKPPKPPETPLHQSIRQQRYDSLTDTPRPDLALLTSLGPEVQAMMILTRFKKPGDQQQQPPAGAGQPQTLMALNHCFISVSLAG
jgi:hypothetical protein